MRKRSESGDGAGKGSRGEEALDRILGECEAIVKVKEQIRTIAPTDLPILIVGETGTGKELVAEAIHACSKRADGPWIPLNCGALSTELLKSELFGHTKGAFTGAVQRREGYFEQATGGTLFFDEISQLRPEDQGVLLRALEGGGFFEVGGKQQKRPDVRVIAATNGTKSERGGLRPDIFYRLDATRIELPPLRERGDNVLLLARAYMTRYAAELERKPRPWSREAEQELLRHHWPGNVRELQNVVRHVLLADGSGAVKLADLPAGLGRLQNPGPAPPEEASPSASDRAHRQKSARSALREAGGNKSQAARNMRIGRSTLRRWLQGPPGQSAGA